MNFNYSKSARLDQKCRNFNLMTFVFLILPLFPFFNYPNDIFISNKFERINFQEELPQVTVNSIILSRQKFLWFATFGGLVKYDGYRIKIYQHLPDNSNSLSSNKINILYEDSKGYIWIGLRGGGLNRFDPINESFVHFEYNSNSLNCIANNYVFSITEDESGNLWTGHYLGGVSKLEIKLNEVGNEIYKITRYRFDPEDQNSLSNNIVSSLCFDNHANLWIGTADGLNRLNISDKIFTRFFPDHKNPRSISSNNITSIYKDSTGSIWIGTQDNGLNRILEEELLKNDIAFTHFKSDPQLAYSLSNNSIKCIYEDCFNNLWIGTLGGGLNKFDRKSEVFFNYKYNPIDKNSISEDYVLSLCQDGSNNLWIGTGIGGINKLSPNSLNFINLKTYASEDQRSNNSIFSILIDENNNLWTGSDKGYLNIYKFERNREVHRSIQKPAAMKTFRISDYAIRSICKDRIGNYWIGTSNDGLFLISDKNLAANNFINYRHIPTDPNSLCSNVIFSILEDRSGTVWFGTGERGVSILTPENRKLNKFINYSSRPDSDKSLSHNFVFKIYEDRNGTIWIGTYSGGLNKFNLKENNFTRFTHNMNDPDSISSNSIRSILEDSSGNFWIGTGDAGLNKFDRKTGFSKKYTKKDGLSDNNIYGILEDSQNYLWLSTNKGLSKFDPVRETFVNFTSSEGLQNNEFNGGAYFKDSYNGQLYFGGINGVTTFFPDTIKKNLFVPPIRITSFSVFNKIKTEEIENNSELVLSYKDYMFSFEFVALDFTNPHKNMYAYKLEGFNEDWIQVDATRRIAAFTNIPPGKYIFRVIGSNNHGLWNKKGLSIKITITPPFWETWIFKFFVIILSSLFILYIHKKRMQNLSIRLKTENEINKIYEKSKMTSREIEIIDMLKNKKSYKEIEDELFISYHTVKNHIHNIFKKLSVTNRAELIYYLKSIEDEMKRDKGSH